MALRSTGQHYHDGRFSAHTTDKGEALVVIDGCEHTLSEYDLDDLEELLHHVATILHSHGRRIDPRVLRLYDAQG